MAGFATARIANIAKITNHAIALLAALALAACDPKTQLPVSVVPGQLSPPYSVTFVNRTGMPFVVLPSSLGAQQGAPAITVAPEGSFKVPLRLRRFTVNDPRSAPGVEVIENAYVGAAMADQAEVRFSQPSPRSLFFLLAHPAWFPDNSETGPVDLVVPVRNFSAAPLFPRGPPGGP